mmetsp:Transcript_9641/g.27336  ORF Transcript_9641/g.27336 Transcript_9641/m.27336 type:complete len:203 (+) Transcript_9641:1389-1997(+)
MAGARLWHGLRLQPHLGPGRTGLHDSRRQRLCLALCHGLSSFESLHNEHHLQGWCTMVARAHRRPVDRCDGLWGPSSFARELVGPQRSFDASLPDEPGVHGDHITLPRWRRLQWISGRRCLHNPRLGFHGRSQRHLSLLLPCEPCQVHCHRPKSQRGDKQHAVELLLPNRRDKFQLQCPVFACPDRSRLRSGLDFIIYHPTC